MALEREDSYANAQRQFDIAADILNLARAGVNFLKLVESNSFPYNTNVLNQLNQVRDDLCRKSLLQLLATLKRVSESGQIQISQGSSGGATSPRSSTTTAASSSTSSSSSESSTPGTSENKAHDLQLKKEFMHSLIRGGAQGGNVAGSQVSLNEQDLIQAVEKEKESAAPPSNSSPDAPLVELSKLCTKMVVNMRER